MKKIFNIYTSTVFGALLFILAEYISLKSIGMIGFTLFFSGVMVLMFKKIKEYIDSTFED